MRLRGSYKAARAHRVGLQALPLSHLWQAVQRALRHSAEPNPDPSDVIALVVHWRLRYKLSLRDLPEMFAIRGIVYSHEVVRECEAKLTPALAEDLRRRQRGKAAAAGMSMRPISRSRDSGAIFIVPLTAPAHWSTNW